jgi:outer membrane protein TolC
VGGSHDENEMNFSCLQINPMIKKSNTKNQHGMKLLITMLCLWGTISFLHAQEVINIDSCYAMAKRNYPAIYQYKMIEQTKEFNISNANKAYLPQFSVTAIGGYIGGLPSFAAPGAETSGSDNFKLIGIGQVSQTLWDGGATRVQKNIAKASADVENASLETSLYTLRERVNQLYFGILLIDEQLKQLSALKDNLGRTLHNVKISKDNGLAFQSDEDEVNAEVIALDQKIVESGYVRKGYVEVLSLLIGVKLPETATFQIPVTIETTLGLDRPELKLFESQRRLVESQSAINKALNMPKFGLMGYGLMLRPEATIGSSSLSSVFVGGLSLSWNTGNLYKSSNNKQIDKIQMDRIANQRAVFVFNNSMQTKQTNTEIEKQKTILARDSEIISLREKIKQAYQHKYDNGLCSMSDVVNSLFKESEARNNQSLHNIQLLLSQYTYKIQNGN